MNQQLDNILKSVQALYSESAYFCTNDDLWKSLTGALHLPLLRETFPGPKYTEWLETLAPEERNTLFQIVELQIRIAIICQRPYEASFLLEKLSFIKGQIEIPYELILRTMLLDRTPIPKVAPTTNSRWVKKTIEKGEDVLFDTEIRQFIIKEEKFSVVLKCSSCRFQFTYHPQETITQDTNLVCPQCLAKLLLHHDNLRRFATQFFKNVFYSLIKTSGEKPLAEIHALAQGLRPYLLVRFGRQRTERIGHQVINTAQFIARKDAGVIPFALDIVSSVPELPVANSFLETLWEKYLSGRPDFISHPIAAEMAGRFHRESEHNAYRLLERPTHTAFAWLRHFDFNSLFRFSKKEIQKAHEELKKMGVQPKKEFICIHLRSKSYLKAHMPRANFEYHNHRDTNFANYLLLIEHYKKLGFPVIKMGAIKDDDSNDVVNDKGEPPYIDYANRHRTPFMDIFLACHSRLMISTSSGIDMIPIVLEKPILCTDFAELYSLGFYKEFFHHPKSFWDIRENRRIGFGEILTTRTNRLNHLGLQNNGIEVRKNTAEELLAVGKEMEAFLNATFEYNDDEKRKVERIREIQRKYPMFEMGGPSTISKLALQLYGFDL